MKHYNKYLTVAIVAAVSFLTTVSALADIEMIHGKAVNSDGELLFLEEHIIKYEGNRIASIKTIYYDANSKKIGQTLSDFSQGPQVGSYEFKDERMQYYDGAKIMEDQILIYCKETPEADTQKKYLDREPSQIVGQGFHSFILANIDALARDDVIAAKLVLPAQMDQFDIRIRKSSFEDNYLTIQIELDNWFLRLFAPRIEAEYDLDSRRLLKYKGVSMIADASGKNVPVTVSYAYSQPNLQVSTLMTPRAVRQDPN
jgi:hypothetical protein